MGVADDVQQRIYVSYAWKAEQQTALVDQLDAACQRRGINLIRDNKAIQYGDSISDYMQALGAGDGVIVILSDEYLKSHYCMSELLSIKNNQQFRDRVFPVHLPDLVIDDPLVRCDYVDYWQAKLMELKTRLSQSDPARTRSIQKDLGRYEQIFNNADDLIDMLSDMYTPPQGIHLETDFDALLMALLQRLPHVATSEPSFSPEDDSEVDVSWADDSGRDEYGWYATLIYQGAKQMFRWIKPGRFWVGSPETELGRFDSETLHEVSLTKGFWLADTTCTQDLWQAVMGENPSEFKKKLRPVENVSWVMAQEFINKLNLLKPGLDLRFPSEAEWEYACRAGTRTPFSFGENINPEQVNYNGKYPYANAKKGLYRRETVAVKSLPANDWSLYEMHGNVWEWCVDWYGAYEAGPVLDPQGATEGVYRVLRGGGWIGDAWLTRSARRYRYDPDYRDSRIGLRLARG